MGGSQSRSRSRDGSGRGMYGQSHSFQQPPSQQWGAGGYPYAPDPQGGYYAAPYPAYQPPPTPAATQPPARAGGASKPLLDRWYSRIADDYRSVDQCLHRWLLWRDRRSEGSEKKSACVRNAPQEG